MPKDRRHAAILFSDIVGYTKLMGSDEDRAFEVLAKNREIHQQLLGQYNGTLIKEMGDGLLISFNLASDAVYCAIEIQKKCKEQDIPLKIGIHEGEMVFEGADVLGDSVNVASRLEADTKEGCITISGSVYRDIKNRKDIQTKFIKEKKFKNVDEPIKVYKVLCEEEVPEQQSSIKDKVENPKSKNPYYIIAGIIIIAIAILIIWKSIPSKVVVELDKSIAVLPFDYLSQEKDKQYLADGIMDAITSNLAKISELRVIAKTTVEQYRDHSIDVRDIGEKIDVSYIVEGSFQLVGNDARLIIQLINTKDGSHVWSDEFDRDWSEIFKVQSEVSQTIAKEIAVKITAETKIIIETYPTSDITAYDYYLRGKDYYRNTKLSDRRKPATNAIKMYEKAVEIDSTFTLAWVGLAECNRRFYWYSQRYQKGTRKDYITKTKQHLTKTKSYLDRAIKLEPDLMEVRLEEGKYYYHCLREHSTALQIFEKLCADYPQDEETIAFIGYLLGNIGEVEKSLEFLKKAISLNPSYWNTWEQAGLTLRSLRKNDEAEIYFKKANILNPSSNGFSPLLFDLYCDVGKLKEARQHLVENADKITEFWLRMNKYYLLLMEGYYEQAFSELEKIPNDTTSITSEFLFYKHYFLGLRYDIVSKEKAIENYKKVKEIFEKNIPDSTKWYDLYSRYAIALAGLGMKNQAIDTVNKAFEIFSYTGDEIVGREVHLNKVRLLVVTGEYEEAIVSLDYVLSRPYGGKLSIEELKLDPFWNPLREMDGFKAIVNNPEYQSVKYDN